MQLIGAWIVHRGRDRAPADMDNLDDAEFDILLQCARGADIDGATQFGDQIATQTIGPRNNEQCDAGRDEMADTALHAYADAVTAREIQQVPGVDETQIARPITGASVSVISR